MQKITRWGTALLAVTTLLNAAAPVFASTPEDEELSAPDVRGMQRKVAPNEVTLGGKTLFVVPTGAGGLSAAERADIIRERLEEIAAHYVVGSGEVTVTEAKPDTFVIAVAGETLATVEPMTAKAAGSKDAETLADNWADRLRDALPKIRMVRQVASKNR